MKVLIVEDENLACERLADLVKQYDEKIEIVGFCDTIKDTVDFFNRGVADSTCCRRGNIFSN